MNDSGIVLFSNTLTGPGITSGNDRSVWVYQNQSLSRLFRDGELFDIDPGPAQDLRTIHNVFFTDPGFAGMTMLNNAGQFVVEMEFSDGTTGMFRVSIPEPSSLGLLTASGLLLARRRFASRSTVN